MATNSPHNKQAVLAIGNFDGVHRGHQELLLKAIEVATKMRRKVGVVTFNPHPRKFFNPEIENFYITPLAAKVDLLKDYGAEILYVIGFDNRFSIMTDVNFIDLFLIKEAEVAHVVIGENFYFGHNRTGNAQLLIEHGKTKGFGVSVVKQLAIDQKIVSSSNIREKLISGDLQTANELLGREWSISGEVVKGMQRGRGLGFPTANIPIHEYLIPAHGVYSVSAIIADKEINGIANIGVRPTFNGKNVICEVHFFDFILIFT